MLQQICSSLSIVTLIFASSVSFCSAQAAADSEPYGTLQGTVRIFKTEVVDVGGEYVGTGVTKEVYNAQMSCSIAREKSPALAGNNTCGVEKRFYIGFGEYAFVHLFGNVMNNYEPASGLVTLTTYGYSRQRDLFGLRHISIQTSKPDRSLKLKDRSPVFKLRDGKTYVLETEILDLSMTWSDLDPKN